MGKERFAHAGAHTAAHGDGFARVERDGGGIKGAHGVKVDGETLMRAYEARGELAQKVAEFGVGLDGLACRMDADEMQAALQIDDLCRANDTFGPSVAYWSTVPFIAMALVCVAINHLMVLKKEKKEKEGKDAEKALLEEQTVV